MVFHSLRANSTEFPGECHRFSEKFIERYSIKSGHKYVKAH
ncbi:hypothetical protein [Siminovitchia terrae]|nr:hypothetical protein [Siminovitchia terrae]